jgi:four helix bundle protein
MNDDGIQKRSYAFALRIVSLCKSLSNEPVERILRGQILRAGTSIGANVEEAQGAQSKKDFVSKMSIARKEARETLYWLRLLRDSHVQPAAQMAEIVDECEQIIRILTSIIISAKQNP